MSSLIVKPESSFYQDQRFVTRSERYQPIQASGVASVLQDHGFNLVSLKESRAKTKERQAHQNTISRYRSIDRLLEDLNLDIMFKSSHLYGKDEFRLGLFKGACANQWDMGKLFKVVKIAHIGDPINEINRIIPELIAQREQLIEDIMVMKSREVTQAESLFLAEASAMVRLEGIDNVKSVNASRLLISRRSEDLKTDLFTTMNRIQENIFRYGVEYVTEKTVNDKTEVKNMTSRVVKDNTQSQIDINSKLWDITSNLLSA